MDGNVSLSRPKLTKSCSAEEEVRIDEEAIQIPLRMTDFSREKVYTYQDMAPQHRIYATLRQ
jgi:hypothetical protein